MDKPSRGQKICRSCSKIIGSKSRTCKHCGFVHQIVESKFKTKGPSFSDSSGKGKKQCPNCKKYVGIKNFKCPNCTTPFVKKVESKIESKIDDDYKPSIETSQSKNDKWDDTDKEFLSKYVFAVGGKKGDQIVFTPSGPYSITLTSNDESGVHFFCDDVINYGFEHRKVYTPRAIKCFGRTLFPIDGFTYEEFCILVDKWVSRIMDVYNRE